MTARVFGILFPVLLVVLGGLVYARHWKPDLSGINKICTDVCLPALVFTSLSQKEFLMGSQGALLLAATLVIFGSGLLAWPVARWLGVDPKIFLPTVMFGNVGPVGLPVTALAFGVMGVAPAVLLLVLSNVFHFTLGVGLMSGKPDFKAVAKTPFIWATVLGLVFSTQQWTLLAELSLALKMLGDVLVPMLLFSLGGRLAGVKWAAWRAGSLGALVPPLAKLLVAAICLHFLPLDPLQRGALLVFAALPPAVFNYLMAERYGRQPDVVASMVMSGHLGALAFLPLALGTAMF